MLDFSIKDGIPDEKLKAYNDFLSRYEAFKAGDYTGITNEELAQLLYSLGSNYAFLTNIIRKSIYEYYVGRRYLLKNQRKSSNLFEQKMQNQNEDLKLLQLDMIISSIEAKWVDNV